MGKKILLEHINVPGIKSLEVYRQTGAMPLLRNH